jgi:hypothetical protein
MRDWKSKDNERCGATDTYSSTVRCRGLCLDLMILAMSATPTEEMPLRESLQGEGNSQTKEGEQRKMNLRMEIEFLRQALAMARAPLSPMMFSVRLPLR